MTDQTEETKISSQTEIASSAVEKLSGWGRVFRPGRQVFSSDLEEASREAVLFRGMGRSYGDSALPPPNRPEVVATPLADRIRFYDRDTGVIRAEAGLTLVKLNRLFLNEGYFVPVTPGTQYVTLGGMVAADVHGKNHHVDGTFGAHIRALKMRVADGSIVECTPENEPDLFRATVGGMGLTGHILEVEFAMKKISSPWIWQEARRIGNLEDFVQALKESAREWPFTVGWIDCLTRGRSMGRGILLCGRWAEPEEAPDRPVTFKDPLPVPLVFPEFVLNKLSVKAFNLLYYRKQFRKIKRGIVNPISFFYPLDILSDWNKLYGPRGFTQHQCVLPEHERPGATRRFFDLLTAKGATSFLRVADCFLSRSRVFRSPSTYQCGIIHRRSSTA
jgi:decaprenylphospho-beta-D-ribofuranose 2-oxidase